MSELQDSLGRGEVIILDGGMGTELDTRGVPMHGLAWSAAAIEIHPEVVRQLHQEYIAAGARVIITNTFASSRLVLEPAGMGDMVAEVNIRAVELARKARDTTLADGPVLVAGSISTVTPLQALPFYAAAESLPWNSKPALPIGSRRSFWRRPG